MKARVNIENSIGIKEFDISVNIIPGYGAGGITFENAISDFESAITANFFNSNNTEINQEFDSKNFYLTLKSKKDEFKIDIDLLNGKISSMICNSGYEGKLINEIGIGSKMSDLIKADTTIGFDLDHEFYIRYPFDGLIIYPPNNLVSKIFNATIEEGLIPDFLIETIEVVDMDFAKKIFMGTIFLE